MIFIQSRVIFEQDTSHSSLFRYVFFVSYHAKVTVTTECIIIVWFCLLLCTLGLMVVA